jgi:hypothetical protein
MKHRSRIALAITTLAALAGSGSAALAETLEPSGTGDVIIELPTVPLPGVGLPELDLTDDQCDPVEAPCDDPGPGDPDPGVPGPDDFTADPCNPIVESCGPGPGETPEPGVTPEPEPCELDDVCTRTPTFTG